MRWNFHTNYLPHELVGWRKQSSLVPISQENSFNIERIEANRGS
jgi:hypothetical protein